MPTVPQLPIAATRLWAPAAAATSLARAPRGTHRRLHVLGLPAERDDHRAVAHGAVPDAAALVIELVPWQRHAAGYGCPQLLRTASPSFATGGQKLAK